MEEEVRLAAEYDKKRTSEMSALEDELKKLKQDHNELKRTQNVRPAKAKIVPGPGENNPNQQQQPLVSPEDKVGVVEQVATNTATDGTTSNKVGS